jgi:hypothetical protein
MVEQIARFDSRLKVEVNGTIHSDNPLAHLKGGKGTVVADSFEWSLRIKRVSMGAG